jgi:hypothetical protein
MREKVDVLRGVARPLLQAGMRENVNDDMVVGADQSPDAAVSCSPSGREHGAIGITKERREPTFELARALGIAHQRRRASAMNPKFVDRRLGGCVHGRMAGEIQVLLRAEIHTRKKVCRPAYPSCKRL